MSMLTLYTLGGGQAVTPSTGPVHHPGQRFYTKAEKRRIHARALAELARQERMWEEDAQQRDEIRNELLDALHPERVIERERQRAELERQISENVVYDDPEDEADVEFLLLHS